MSLESWKAEFYPVPASEVSEEDALDHSIRKWDGLTKENLERHGLSHDEDGDILDNGHVVFRVDSYTCSLCEVFTPQMDDDECDACPLYQERNGVACCEHAFGEDDSPYGHYRVSPSHDPLPMLNLLKRVKAKQEAEKQP